MKRCFYFRKAKWNIDNFLQTFVTIDCHRNVFVFFRRDETVVSNSGVDRDQTNKRRISITQ